VLRQVSAWLRDHPRQADGVLAAALLVFTVPQLAAGQSDAAARTVYVAVTMLLAGTVAVRRQHPCSTPRSSASC
jgi:hypothetical protein